MKKEKHVLNVQSRTLKGTDNARRLRKQGRIPAVIYSKGAESTLVSVDSREWDVLSRAELNLILLKEGSKEKLVLLKEVQNDFIRNCASHLDFMEVSRDQKIVTKIPLHQSHEQPAGISAGGLLEQNLYEVEVECTPDTLPEHVEVNLAAMNVGDVFHVSDIQLPEGVRMVTPADLVAFAVIDATAIPEEETPEAAAEGEGAGTEPEVIGEKERAEKAAAAEAEKAEKSEKKKA